MIDEALIKESVQYFRENQGFERVFQKLKHKYKTLGRLGGKIEFKNLSCEEKEALTGFLKKDFLHKRSVQIKVSDFQEALESTRFCGVLLEDILKEYFDEILVSNKDVRLEYLKQRESYFYNIIAEYENTVAGNWLKYIIETKDNAYRLFIQRYESDREKLSQDIKAVCDGINNLPVNSDKRLRLPIFASEITKNPHSFDESSTCGQIFIYALMYCFEAEKPKNAEQKSELYYSAGILFDELSNFVLLSGLSAYTDGNIHQGWEGFYNSKEPLQVSLSNLSKIDRVVSPTGKVFVFENTGVFSVVMDRTSHINRSIVCTCGQVKVASLVLLDMLAKEGADIYYSGDFDPEGLRIASRLKNRYGDRLKLWRYEIEDYKTALSNEIIDDIRLKKLENLDCEELISTADVLRNMGYAGYQELLIDSLVNDICEFDSTGTFS